MTRQQLARALATTLGRSKADAVRIVEAIFGAEGLIAAELRRGRKVQITGFGSFETRKRAARPARNPRPGRAMTIKASVVPVFRAGSALKDRVNRR